ncbi:hypothetical protein NL676_005671 [Syzygium grande]|nr:hypothetical protein NL676_005671 [Syzygium grande]
MDTRLVFTGNKKGAMLTAEELESISKSFHESLRSRLWGLSPASASLPWFSSAVEAITYTHSAARSLIYELNLDDGNSLSLWYSDDSPKVLDICNCISSEIERLCLLCSNLRIAVKLLRSDGDLSEEDIHRVRDLLADWVSNGKGGHGCLKSADDIEVLIRDLAASVGMSVPRGKVSPVERVVCRAIRAVSFVTAFLAGVISSAMYLSSRAVISVPVPEEFPWGDSVRAIRSAVIVDSECSEATDRQMQILKELDDMEPSVKELDDTEVSVWHVLETIEDVGASGGGGEIAGRLREAIKGLEKVTEAMSEGLYQLRERVNELCLTVTRMRKEMLDEFPARVPGDNN